MTSIKKLLNKKGWTGRELGRIELANLCLQRKGLADGNREKNQLVDEEQLAAMVKTLQSSEDINTYNGYLEINNWLQLKSLASVGMEQSAQVQFWRLYSVLMLAMQGERIRMYQDRLPIIMTQKQYDDLRTKRLEASFKDGNGNDLEYDVFDLVTTCVDYYRDVMKKGRGKPCPLKDIQKKYQSEQVKGKYLLEHWNEWTGNGYYTIEDGTGRRSDQMTTEEWQAAISAGSEKTPAADGEQRQDFDRYVQHERLVTHSKVLYAGGTTEEADQAVLDLDVKEGRKLPTKWHLYEEPPSVLTKWDVVESGVFADYYANSDEEEWPTRWAELYAEFKELIDFALKDMDAKYFKAPKEKVSKLPVKKWGTHTVSVRRLYELDFYGSRASHEDDVFTFMDDEGRLEFRPYGNGVAILRPCDRHNVDDNGYYVEPTLDRGEKALDGFLPEAETYAQNIKMVEDARAQLENAYYYLMGYNKQIDLVAELYEVPDLEVFKANTGFVESKIESINNFVAILYSVVNDGYYADQTQRDRRLEVLHDVFPPFDYKSVEIPEENIRRFKEEIKSFRSFRTNRAMLDNLLCFKPVVSARG